MKVLDQAAVNAQLATATPQEIVAWAQATMGTDLLMSSSFGAESMCLIHMAIQAQPKLRIIFVNTGFLFPETLAFRQQLQTRFNLNVLEYQPLHDPQAWLAQAHEPDPTQRQNIAACCAANKNELFDRAMREQKPLGWLRGVRADQTETRAKLQPVEWSARYQCWAISPLLRWNNRTIHGYMTAHDLPYHPLWELGYTSIGCAPTSCTVPLTIGGDPRGGRWSGTDKRECGLHLDEPTPPQS
ncbi:MAG: phosphoadenylyl-sulfate reductase [Phycisphaerae bacterium]